jgi:hypothetical protein
MHVLGWSQGVATLAQAFKDKAYVEREVSKILSWLDGVIAGTQQNKIQ